MTYPKNASLTGYKYGGLTAGAARYKRFNNAVTGSMGYSAGAPSKERLILTFSAAPADGSGLSIPNGPPNAPNSPAVVFTFVYGGSPGAGIIPLVGGGGTAAQAAAAAQVAIAAQVSHWVATNPSAGELDLVSVYPGLKVPDSVISGGILIGTTNITITDNPPSFGQLVPGGGGKRFSFLPY